MSVATVQNASRPDPAANSGPDITSAEATRIIRTKLEDHGLFDDVTHAELQDIQQTWTRPDLTPAEAQDVYDKLARPDGSGGSTALETWISEIKSDGILGTGGLNGDEKAQLSRTLAAKLRPEQYRDFVARMGDALPQKAPSDAPNRTDAGHPLDDARNRGTQWFEDQVDKGKRALGALGRNPREAASDAVHALTAPVDQLGPGDSVRLQAEENVDARVLGINGQQGVEVKRGPDGVYTISGNADASLGAGLGRGGAEATAGLGVRAEFRTTSRDEARRLADAYLKVQAQAAAQALTQGSGVAKPLVGTAARAVVAPSEEEQALLRSRLSALEIQGRGAVSLGSKFGLSSPLSGQVEAQGVQSLRVEFNGMDKPTAVVLKTTREVNGQTKVSVPGVKLLPGQQGSTTITEELRVGVQESNVGASGLFGLKQRGPVNYHYTIQGQAWSGATGGYEGKIDLGNITAEQAKAALPHLLRGDVAQAAKAADLHPVTTTNRFVEHRQGGGVDAVLVGGKIERRLHDAQGPVTTTTGLNPSGAGGQRIETYDGFNLIDLSRSGPPKLPHGPGFAPAPTNFRGNWGADNGAALAWEKHVGQEIATGLNLPASETPSVGTRTIFPDSDKLTRPKLLHEPKLNASGMRVGDEPFNRPDWVVVGPPGNPNGVLAVEATGDVNFQIPVDTGMGDPKTIHKKLQLTNQIFGLTNKYPDRELTLVIRSPHRPGPQAIETLRQISQDPKLANRHFKLVWVAG